MASDHLIRLNMKEVVRAIERSDKELAKELVSEMRTLTKWSAGRLKDAAPVRTGKLQKSIKGSTTKNRALVRGSKQTWFANYGRKTYYPWTGSRFVNRTEEAIGPMIEKAGKKILERTADKFVGK